MSLKLYYVLTDSVKAVNSVVFIGFMKSAPKYIKFAAASIVRPRVYEDCDGG